MTIRKITCPRHPHEIALAAVQRAFPGRRVSGRGESGVRVDGILWDWAVEDTQVVLHAIGEVLAYDGPAGTRHYSE